MTIFAVPIFSLIRGHYSYVLTVDITLSLLQSWLTRRRMPSKISIPMVSSQPQMIEVFTCLVQSLYYYYKIHLCF